MLVVLGNRRTVRPDNPWLYAAERRRDEGAAAVVEPGLLSQPGTTSRVRPAIRQKVVQPLAAGRRLAGFGRTLVSGSPVITES